MNSPPPASEKSTSQKEVSASQTAISKYPFYCVRFWHGMPTRAWWKLLWDHRFRVDLVRIPMAFLVSLVTPTVSFLSFIQRMLYGSKIRDTKIEMPPIFIVGHWRSGTTYLHELMALDERLGWPNTYQCFSPRHWLITEKWLAPLLSFLLPKERPMDNMELGWDRPQEDEFAMVGYGAPTPYLRIAFPNEPDPYPELYDMKDVDPKVLRPFATAIVAFVKALTFRYKKRILLKSPPHTGRISFLAKAFPGAKFIHITRHPDALLSSTCRLWESLDAVNGLQIPRNEHLREFVLDTFERMYAGFDRQRPHIDPKNIVDIRYEDLVANPVGSVRSLYETLSLGDFEPVAPKIEAYTAERKSYQTNKHKLDDESKAEIRRRWANYFRNYGYE